MDDRPAGVSESYGTLRFGKLLELLLYDCRRHQTLKGKLGSLVPEEVEAWLHARMASTDTRHLIQVPSIPVGWTAGKWGEWYPDVLGRERRLTIEEPKDFWQPGWLRQHDRLLASASAMKRLPLFLNGDLHSVAEATIERSGEHDFSRNPIRTAVVGPLGTCSGWPSTGGRGTRGVPSAVLDAQEDLASIEENGFVLADVATDEITLSYFRWAPLDRRTGLGGEEKIDSLEPFRVTRLR
jgi:phosphodiesterase/alkaline phosphatase D-like protein